MNIRYICFICINRFILKDNKIKCSILKKSRWVRKESDGGLPLKFVLRIDG